MSTKKSLKNEKILSFDYTTEIMLLIADILSDTIKRTIEEESEGNDGPPIPEEILLQKSLAMNIDKFIEDCNLTTGPDGKIYLAGSWLMRPVYYRGRMIPMMFFLEENLDPEKFDMIAEKTGPDLRQILWSDLIVNGSSYNLSRSCKVPDWMDSLNISLEKILPAEKMNKFRNKPVFMKKAH